MRLVTTANTFAALALALAMSCKRPPPHATATGQWIWSSADSTLFDQASRSIPDLVPTVWIGTIRASKGGAVDSQLALSPTIAARPKAAVVIRFDDSFSNAWAASSDSAIASMVGATLREMLRAADATGVKVSEVQLDYDCPERLLERWSVVVAQLSLDPLLGRKVWLTSLVSHVRHRNYGDLFRDNVAGHILQVFDTGDRMSLPYVRQIERLASRQRMPFRLGIAAFERRFPNGRTTNHQAWFDAPRVMRDDRWYRGVWVFPGGVSWAHLLESTK